MNPNIVTVSPKYQIVIPKAVRESAGIKPGAKLMVISLGGVIRLMPIKPAAAYRGIARGLAPRCRAIRTAWPSPDPMKM